jgi:hypothetical protein
MWRELRSVFPDGIQEETPVCANLFAALRAAFPSDLDAIAIETDNGLAYSWRDLERGTAMIANLLSRSGWKRARASRCRWRSRSRR